MEIRRISEDQVCAEALQALVPGWMGTPARSSLRDALFDAWQHFGWRFQEDRLHPGMSDRAWQVRAESTQPLQATARGGRTLTPTFSVLN